MSNDRFKFRCWDNINKRYDKDFSLIDKDGDLCYQDGEKYCNGQHPEDFTIEQCTGLKDRNGKLIFEGDVVKCDLDNLRKNLINQVVWWKGCFFMKRYEIVQKEVHAYYNFEVIGNIHEMKVTK